MRHPLTACGILLLIVELLCNRLVAPLSASMNTAIAGMAAVLLVVGIVMKQKEKNDNLPNRTENKNSDGKQESQGSSDEKELKRKA